ncbi:MAG: hypothetical protein AAGD35_19260 [Actinomycetota bacterium]
MASLLTVTGSPAAAHIQEARIDCAHIGNTIADIDTPFRKDVIAYDQGVIIKQNQEVDIHWIERKTDSNGNHSYVSCAGEFWNHHASSVQGVSCSGLSSGRPGHTPLNNWVPQMQALCHVEKADTNDLVISSTADPWTQNFEVRNNMGRGSIVYVKDVNLFRDNRVVHTYRSTGDGSRPALQQGQVLDVYLKASTDPDDPAFADRAEVRFEMFYALPDGSGFQLPGVEFTAYMNLIRPPVVQNANNELVMEPKYLPEEPTLARLGAIIYYRNGPGIVGSAEALLIRSRSLGSSFHCSSQSLPAHSKWVQVAEGRTAKVLYGTPVYYGNRDIGCFQKKFVTSSTTCSSRALGRPKAVPASIGNSCFVPKSAIADGVRCDRKTLPSWTKGKTKAGKLIGLRSDTAARATVFYGKKGCWMEAEVTLKLRNDFTYSATVRCGPKALGVTALPGINVCRHQKPIVGEPEF